MSNKLFYILTVVIIIISTLIGIYYYPHFPELVASHWGINGEVDGYMNKFWGVFLLPIVIFGMLCLFIILPKIDPLKKNILSFQKVYNNIIFSIIILLTYIYALSIYWNIGNEFNFTSFTIPSMGALFIYLGILLPTTKRNWFLGIRTPWTISNDVVWDKTHLLAGKLFILSGITTLFSIIIPTYSFLLMMSAILISTLILVIYSYLLYQNHN